MAIRDHCANTTAGSDRVEHFKWQALDLYAESFAAGMTDQSDQRETLLASAATIAHELVNLKMTQDQYNVWASIRDMLGSAY